MIYLPSTRPGAFCWRFPAQELTRGSGACGFMHRGWLTEPTAVVGSVFPCWERVKKTTPRPERQRAWPTYEWCCSLSCQLLLNILCIARVVRHRLTWNLSKQAVLTSSNGGGSSACDKKNAAVKLGTTSTN